MKTLLIMTVILILVLFVSCAGALGPPAPLGFGPPFDQLAPFLLVFLVAVFAWKRGPEFISRYKKPNGTDRVDETVETTIRRRYARGEITRDQFLQMLEDVGRKSQQAGRQ